MNELYAATAFTRVEEWLIVDAFSAADPASVWARSVVAIVIDLKARIVHDVGRQGL